MGLTPNVVANTPILSTWGNEIRDRSVQVFATAAERASLWPSPPIGAHSYLSDSGGTFVYYGATAGWRLPWALPWGVIAAATPRTAAQSGMATGSDIIGSSFSFTAVANRRYVYRMNQVPTAPSVVADRWSYNAILDTTIIKGYMGALGNQSSAIAGGAVYIGPLTAGSHSLKTQAVRAVGSGLLDIYADANAPTFAWLEDIGPQGVPA